VAGEPQGAGATPSRLHSKREPASEEVNWNSTSTLRVRVVSFFGGRLVITAFGGAVSILKLRDAGVSCDLVTVKGAPHRLTEWEKFDPSYKDQMLAWLDQTLRK